MVRFHPAPPNCKFNTPTISSWGYFCTNIQECEGAEFEDPLPRTSLARSQLEMIGTSGTKTMHDDIGTGSVLRYPRLNELIRSSIVPCVRLADSALPAACSAPEMS